MNSIECCSDRRIGKSIKVLRSLSSAQTGYADKSYFPFIRIVRTVFIKLDGGNCVFEVS